MRAARFLIILLVLAAILAALAFVFRLPIAGWAARQAMAAAGLENPSARATALTFSGARLEGVAAGPEGARDFSFEAIEADFSLRRLFAEKKVEALRAGPGVVRVRVDEAGGASVAGFETGGDRGDGGGVALPFDRLLLRGVVLAVTAPDGEAAGTVDAEYDIGQGGAGAITLEAEHFAWSNIRLADLKATATANLSADGKMTFAAELTGAAEAPGAAIRNVAAKIEGEASSWRDAAAGAAEKVSGKARVSFSAPDIEIRDAKAQSLMSASATQTVFGENVQEAALSGAFDVALSGGGLAVRLDGGAPLTLETPDGASLALTPQGDAPFVSLTGEKQTASFRFVLAGGGATMSGGVDAMREGANWRLAAPVEIGEFAAGALALGASRVDVSAVSDGGRIDADIAVKSGLKRAKIGRLTISEAPFSGSFAVNADMTAQRASIASKSECFAVDRGRGAIEEQNLDMRFTAMSLCNGGGPLAEITWAGDPAVSLSGEVSAADAAIRFGETHAKGRPPAIRFDAAYSPAVKTTAIKGEASGGAMTLNEAIVLSGVAGDFDFSLDAETMRAAASIDRLRIAQHLAEEGALPFFSPVAAAGEASLEGDDARFSYVLTTPEGRRIGEGAGAHDMASASGETVLSMDGTQFRPDGLQPNRLSPLLKGIVDAAEGGLDGSVRFGWSPGGVTSGADFHFNSISFGGPTRAVTRTSDVAGDVRLTALFPLATDGAQTITVGGVDLDALQLEAGAITFELPGDDTLHLVSAEFPWFGGVLGVYEATASFAGEAMIPLRAQDIDLKQILDYVNVAGLSGEGVLQGSLPLVFRDGRAFIEDGFIESVGSGVIRYAGAATEQAASEGGGAKIAFDMLKDLRYRSMKVTVSGPLDGRLEFDMEFVGTGEMVLPQQGLNPGGQGRLPVLYRITLDAALIDLLQQALLSTDVRLQIQQSVSGGKGGEPQEPEP